MGDKFLQALTDYFKSKTRRSMSQVVVAKRAGISAQHLNDMVRGRAAGSDEVRRAIAVVLGWDYDRVMGRGHVSLRQVPLPAVDLSQVSQYGKEGWLIIVPVVSPAAAARGFFIDIMDELYGWVAWRNMKSESHAGVVVVEMPDASMALAVPIGTRLVVRLYPEAGAGPEDIVDGGFYLVGAPSPVPIRQVFWEQESRDAVILSSVDGRAARPQVLPLEQWGAIQGRVVEVLPLR